MINEGRRPQLGDIRFVGNEKQVCINTESVKLSNISKELQKVICAINHIVPQLQLLGLADTLDEVCANCIGDKHRIFDNLVKKYIAQEKDWRKAYANARRDIDLVFGPDGPRGGVDPYMLVGYEDCVDFKDGKLCLNGERLNSRFGVWVSGVAADNFLKYSEALATLRDTVEEVVPKNMKLPELGALRLTDDFYAERMFLGKE